MLKDIIKWHLCSQQHYCLQHFIVLALRAVQQHVYKVAVFEEVDKFQYRQLQQEDGSMALKERLLQLLVVHQKGKQKINMKPVTFRFYLPVRNQAKGKRPHNLAKNMLNNSQNAGKW